MLGKLCAVCLWKYVRMPFLGVLQRRGMFLNISMTMGTCAQPCDLPVDFCSIITHNCKDTHSPSGEADGKEFTPRQAPSASLRSTGCHPPAPPSGDRSSVSRQRLLRSERPGAGQVRDVAQRSEGGARSGGGGRSLWLVSPGLLRHARVVRARGTAGAGAAEARAEAATQAQRRSACDAGSGYPRGRTDAEGRGIGGASGAAQRRRGASAEYPAQAASLSAAAGKKTPVIIEGARLDARQYTLHYELLRSQVIETVWNVGGRTTVDQPRGIGLALLLSEGMPGWLKAVEMVLRTSLAPREVDSPAPSPQRSSAVCSAAPTWLPSVQRHEITSLLASLVLSTRLLAR